jgi:hypothetical protein
MDVTTHAPGAGDHRSALSSSSGAVGWPLSLGLQLVEIEALARIDRRRARRWGLLAALLGGLAVALMLAGRTLAVATVAAPPGEVGPGVAPAVLAIVALAGGVGCGVAGGAALRSVWSAHQREADAFTRQLRYGSERGLAP